MRAVESIDDTLVVDWPDTQARGGAKMNVQAMGGGWRPMELSESIGISVEGGRAFESRPSPVMTARLVVFVVVVVLGTIISSSAYRLHVEHSRHNS